MLKLAILFIFFFLPLVNCNDESSKKLSFSENYNDKEITTPKKKHKNLSPGLIWKSFLGNGKVQLLKNQKLDQYYYLERSNSSGKSFAVIKVNKNNGKKPYYKRDHKYKFARPFVKNNIFFYNNRSGLHGFHLMEGKEVMSLKKGYFKPTSSFEKEKQSLILLNYPELKNRSKVNIINYSTNSKKAIWQKSVETLDVADTDYFIVYIDEKNNFVMTNKKSGKNNKLLMKLVNTGLKEGKDILAYDNNNIYILNGQKLLSLSLKENKINWEKDLNSKFNFVEILNKKNIIVRSGIKLSLVNRKSGDLIWTKDYSGNIHNLLSGKILIFMTAKKLFAVDLESGNQIWEINHPSYRNYPYFYNSEYFYFKAIGNGMYFIKKISPLTKPLEISYKTRDNGQDVYSQKELNIKRLGSYLFLASNSSKYLGNDIYEDRALTLKAFDTKTDSLLWSYKDIKAGFIGQAILKNNLIIFATNEGTILALDIKTGKREWYFKTDIIEKDKDKRYALQILLVEKNRLYIYYSGYLYALDLSRLVPAKKKRV